MWWIAPDTAIEEPIPEQVERAEVIERIDRELSAHEHASHEPAVQIDDEAEPRELRGNPDRPIAGPGRESVERQPPLNDAEAWRQRRLDEARILRDSQVAAAREFCRSNGCDGETTELVAGAVDHLHAELIDLKRQVEEGVIAPAVLREQTPDLRRETEERVRGLLGADGAAALNLALREADRSGGFQ